MDTNRSGFSWVSMVLLAVGALASGCESRLIDVTPSLTDSGVIRRPGDAGHSDAARSTSVVTRDGAVISTSDGATTPDSGPATGTVVIDPNSGLPELPLIRNVRTRVDGDSVSVTFQPVDDARDYRIYALPSKDRIHIDSTGVVAITDATYRCSGDREAPSPMIDDGPDIQSNAVRTIVDAARHRVFDYQRRIEDAILGYAFAEPGEGRSAVYVLGDPDAGGDNHFCYFAQWNATRLKRYTSSTSERDRLLALGWRDDGIGFYVPSSASSATRSVEDAGDHLLVTEGSAEQASRGSTTPLFEVLREASDETFALYRVYYEVGCGTGHDELALGETLFERLRYQGDDKPVTELVYSGITEPTVLVVEALDTGCPFQGRLAAKSIPPATYTGVDYSPAYDVASLRAMDPNGEVFINGQHESDNRPQAVARTFIQVAPSPRAPMDFFDGFEQPLAALTGTRCSAPDGNCWGSRHWRSSDYDVEIYNSEVGEFAIGAVGGELWATHADIGAGVNGMLRVSPLQTATMSPDSYLHVTMGTDCITTGRRYPQLLISDREAPIQRYLEDGNTIVVQPFGDWPNRLDVQICDHRTWQVNDQCPRFEIFKEYDSEGSMTGVNPAESLSEACSGADRRARFDVYASTQRAYVFLDDRPYGCADLPRSGVPNGTVSVTFGDVLYHSGVDYVSGFHERALRVNAQRRFDNFGFSSGVAAPEWDHELYPCTPADRLGE